MPQEKDLKSYIELVQTVFCTPSGEELLKELSIRYEQRISFRPGEDALTMAFCEGQRDVVLALRLMKETDPNELLIETNGDIND